jgi:quercetin dioxygenase-like cupin family protein
VAVGICLGLALAGAIGVGRVASEESPPLAAGQVAHVLTTKDADLLRDLAARAAADPKGVASREVARTAGCSATLLAVVGEIPPHKHEVHDEVVHVFAGRGSFLYGGGEKVVVVEVGPGTTLVIPRGTIHAYRAAKEAGPTLALVVNTPPFDGKDRVPASFGTGEGGK